ncbi:MAG: YbjQ family protein [Planctomycetota bacterium]
MNIFDPWQIGLAVVSVVVPLTGAYFFGRAVERRHFRQIEDAERELSGILVSDLKRIPPHWRVEGAQLVCGEVAIATDYFKVFIAGWKKVFGGRLSTFETLVERARREAIVRMLYEAQSLGANVVWNVHVQCGSLLSGEERKPGGVLVIAYGTAMRAEADV